MSRLSTQLLEGPSARLVVDQAELRVVAGPDKGLRVTLGTDSLVIGSSSDCDLVLHDSSVSSRHCEVQSTARGYSIRDLGSTNGIYLAGHAIERAPLGDGMKLALGETTIVVHALGKQTSVPLAQPGHVGSLVALSVKMRAFVAQLTQVASSDATVLIEGETGTGKELAAQTVHALSARRNAPFVVFDCGAISPSLVVSELFGHDKGSFTGAADARAGLFEEAEGGTLFLDEIGELPIETQSMLLGAIERKRSRRIGGRGDIAHDVRIVAATHRNLAEDARTGKFRQDLFYRLAVVKLRVPPLRERPDDLPTLADQFAREAGVQLAPESLAPLLAYEWPGNVRELRNAVLRLAIDPSADPAAGMPAAPLDASFLDEEGRVRSWLEVRRLRSASLERDYFSALLKRTNGNQAKAAELAGVTPQSVGAIVNKHGLRKR